MSPPISDAQTTPPRLFRLAGAVIWPSFFSAAVATMMFFAFIDPLALAEIGPIDIPVSRQTGYSIGFFLFWSATFSSSLFTTWLQQPSTKHP
jgi:hypothetical protein